MSDGFDQLDLARKIHLSPPAIYKRMKRLERAGVIRQYVALIDWESASYDLFRVSLIPDPKWGEIAAVWLLRQLVKSSNAF